MIRHRKGPWISRADARINEKEIIKALNHRFEISGKLHSSPSNVSARTAISYRIDTRLCGRQLVTLFSLIPLAVTFPTRFKGRESPSKLRGFRENFVIASANCNRDSVTLTRWRSCDQLFIFREVYGTPIN